MQQIKMFDIDKYREIEDFINKSRKKTKIIAISKNHPLKTIEEAISYGILNFGENRVQEAKLKFDPILKENPLQSLLHRVYRVYQIVLNPSQHLQAFPLT